MRPVSAAFRVSQPFGSMKTQGVAANPDPNSGAGYYVHLYGNYQPYGHAGCDIACPEGTPVYAIASGTVLWADWGTKLPGDESNAGYRRRWYLYKGFPGIVTVIQHAGWIGVYAHLSAAWLNVGDKVTEGQQIGLSGGTGGVAPHLHVEALVDLTYKTFGGLIYGRTDPEPYFGSAAIAPQGNITPASAPEGFLDMLTEQQQKDIYYILCTEEGRQIRAQQDADVLLAASVPMLDGGKPSVAELLAVVNRRLKEIQDGTNLIQPLNIDLRGEADKVRAKLATLSAVDVPALAAALSEQLPQADAEALVDALAKRLGQ